MSQPEKPKPTGPAALKAAAEKATRRPAPVVDRNRAPGKTPPPPPPPAPKAPAQAPEIPQEPTDTGAEGESTGATVTTLPTAQQPPVAQQQPQAPVTVETVIETPVVPAPVEQAPTPPTPTPVQPVAPPVVEQPPAQPTLATLLRKKPASSLTPVQQEMYSNEIAKKFKSVANIIRMLSERADESAAVIKEAQAAGYPANEVTRIAITHGIEDWLPFILATEDDPQK